MLLKIVSTIAFAVFCILAGYSTYQLGLGLYGIPLTLLAMAGAMWEVWVQPVRDEARRQAMLAGLDDWDYKPARLGNIADAKEAVADLEDRVRYVTEAYAMLKEEQTTEDNDAS